MYNIGHHIRAIKDIMKPLKDNQHNVNNKGNKGLELYTIQKLPNYHKVPGHHQLVDIAHKSQKIATAVYMVTDLIGENDPLVHALRSTSVNTMELLFSMVSLPQTERVERLSEVAGSLFGLGSYLQVIYHNGRISDMNYHLLSSEIINIQERVDTLVNKTMPYDRQKRSSRLVDEFTFTDRFFETGYEGVPSVEEEPEVIKDTKDELKDTKKAILPVKKTSLVSPLLKTPKVLPKKKNEKQVAVSQAKVSVTTPKPKGQKKPVRPVAVSNNVKDGRQENILKILKQKKDAKIGDLTSLINDFGAKTVQRDLNEMVKKGLVTKEGERRWSIYNLAY